MTFRKQQAHLYFCFVTFPWYTEGKSVDNVRVHCILSIKSTDWVEELFCILGPFSLTY